MISTFVGVGVDPTKNTAASFTLVDFKSGETDTSPVFVFDLDGTLSNSDKRIYHVNGQYKDFDKFNALAIEDQPHAKIVMKLIEAFEMGAQIWIATGRSDRHVLDTIRWLHMHSLLPMITGLLMRNHHSHVSAVELKMSMLNFLVQSGLVVVSWTDDDDKVLSALREFSGKMDVVDAGLILKNIHIIL